MALCIAEQYQNTSVKIFTVGRECNIISSGFSKQKNVGKAHVCQSNISVALGRAAVSDFVLLVS
jgi:hypothetical protein